MSNRSLAATTVLGFALLLGCRTTGDSAAFRLPGTTKLPSTASVPTPKLTPGGRTPAVPGITATSMRSSAPQQADEIAQVGFVDRLRAAKGGGVYCGDCEVEVDANCMSCEPPVAGFFPRPTIDPQEFLCNGGDAPEAAILRKDGYVAGLEPADAVVHYTTEAGDIKLQASNRVCVYSPRFGSVRQVSSAAGGERTVALQGIAKPVGPTGVGMNQPSLAVGESIELGRADVARRVDAMRDRNRGVPVESVVAPELAEDVLAILATLDFASLGQMGEAQIAVLREGALAARSWMVRDAVEVMFKGLEVPVLTRDQRAEAFVEYDFPDAGRLKIMKVADKSSAELGDEIHFAIHVQNVGDSPVSDIEIVDSLVTRLEYVEDSQKCDREADFMTRGNEAGSVRLSWKLKEPLAVGKSAHIEFSCKVR
ncbi:MAG: DUF11 domain-containing protein [Planctomycetota bacterium]